MTGAADRTAARIGLLAAYRMRWKRRRLLWPAFRSRHDLKSVMDRTGRIGAGDILVFMVLRNEAARLPHFLKYYRGLGVGHFLVVDNDSTDDTAALLQDQEDLSLWRTKASYRKARFGVDWTNWLLARYGHGRWCLVLDADELLVYPRMDELDLPGLTRALEARGQNLFGALMLDMYAKGPLGTTEPGSETETDPIKALPWFDAGPYRCRRQTPIRNLWVQGGVRERVFFADEPRRAPTLNKLPLIRWNRRWALVNSCHALLPPDLNMAYDGPGGTQPSGVLLHSKFLPDIIERAREDATRKQHFKEPQKFRDYYAKIETAPVLWHEDSVRYQGWKQLVELGLMRDLDKK
ncbi:glycosyltransferase family 2 protein [Sulfitobacter sp. BDSS02]|nr:glycosyltransferase family 2 protein [Sulfitobacter sp. BDSS02]MBR9848756.1 glycosyltransferase family 2 protein [Paracoccaceae bacterium]